MLGTKIKHAGTTITPLCCIYSYYTLHTGKMKSAFHNRVSIMCLPNTLLIVATMSVPKYRGADKSLARPGRKKATATEDFEVHISYL
jgi:hypothetical protein